MGALFKGSLGGCVILTVGEESRSLWGLLPANITSGQNSSFEGTNIARGCVAMLVFPVVCVCVRVSFLPIIAWLESSVSR